eukprot:scaffold44593_cov41-Phaeocystis_antarctica.AAC.1
MTNGVRTHDLGLRRLLPVGAARLLCRTVRAPPADRRGRGSRALDAPAIGRTHRSALLPRQVSDAGQPVVHSARGC